MVMFNKKARILGLLHTGMFYLFALNIEIFGLMKINILKSRMKTMFLMSNVQYK